MGNPEFKDALRDLLENNGGLLTSNLEAVSHKLRSYDETLTTPRLQGLLKGMKPTLAERRAISLVLEPSSEQWLSENWLLEDIESRTLANFAFAYMRSHVLAKDFVYYVLAEARFRNEDRSDRDLAELHSTYITEREMEDEIEIFDLRV